MKIQLLYFDESYLPELDYLCKLFGSIMEVTLSHCHEKSFKKNNLCSIGYCSREKSSQLPESCRIRIHCDTPFWKSYLKKELPKINKRELADFKVLNANNDEVYLFREENKLITNMDLFTSAFFIVTGMEEIYSPHLRDNHGRFLFSQSKWAHLYVDEPLVNAHAKILVQWIEEVYGLKVKSGRRFTAVLTHDIDSPFYYGTLWSEISEIIASLSSRGKYTSLADVKSYVACLLGLQPDLHDTFSYIQEQEGKRGIPSTYFILLSKDNAWGLDRNKYAKTLRNILCAGNEIALHPGYDSFQQPEVIAREKMDLEDLAGTTVQGVRNHFLRFKLPDTYHLLSKLGLSYDATMGFPDREGFRHGICTPYKPYDILRRTMVEIMEIPLVAMDGTLREYRRFFPENALKSIENLVQVTSLYGGTIACNWHNSFLLDQENAWRHVYEKSLSSLAYHFAIFSTCHQVANHSRVFW